MIYKYAYVWAVFKGDRYIPGVLTSAWSIIRTDTVHDLVCMVTNDVSDKARKELKKLSIKVIEIPYIFGRINFKTKRQKKLYNDWMQISYTKWNALNLTQYNKIFFLDADTIVTQNIDDIFEYKRPSSNFYNPFSEKYKKVSKIKDYYGSEKVIKPSLINKALTKGGFVFWASSVLITPNNNHYNEYIKMVKNNKYVEQYIKNNYSGADEQSLAYFMSLYPNGPKSSWNNLPECYQYIPWHNNECCSKENKIICSDIKVIHYFGEFLLWEIDFNKIQYDDIKVWLAMFKEMINNSDIKIQNINIKYPESIKMEIDYDSKYFNLFKDEMLPISF